ncbi:MAG: exosortase A [Noviherbaspirillum sp.]
MILTETRVVFPSPARMLAIVIALLAPFLIYLGTARSIVAIWDSSETFAHGYIILPITLWLVWKRRDALAQMAPQPFWPAMLLLLACGFGWLLAELGDVQVVRQYAFVAMIPLTVVAVLGWRIAKQIAFPLFFLMLAVPFGDIFIGPLIDHTADFTVAALQLTGIPVLREGNNFSIPSGNWSVVEACSGLRYLVASITLGALYAHLTYRSPVRQAMFMLVSVVVPIVANWLRAYMIVMIGHLSGMELATGVDHLIYGWLFFGLVMFLMFWIGSFWREDDQKVASNSLLPMREKGEDSRHYFEGAIPTKKDAPQKSNTAHGETPTFTLITAAALAIACIAAWPLYRSYLEQATHNPTPPSLSAFQGQWETIQPFTTWKPDFHPPATELTQSYRQGSQRVALAILYYRNQQKGAGLISSTNRMAAKDDLWRITGSAGRAEAVAGRTLAVRETRLQGPSGRLVAWHWYWIDGRFTTSDYLGKLLQAKQEFLLQGDDGASLLAAAPYEDNPEAARETLRRFLDSNLPALQATLDANRNGN